MYKMSSSTWSNYSNQAAALRGSLQAPAQEEGAEKENDRKAFLAEAIQGTAQFIKERVGEKIAPTLAGFSPIGNLISKVTKKSVTPLKDAATAARQAAKDAEAGIDKAGMDESEELAGYSARTAAAKVAQVAAQTESESSTAIDAALTAARTAGSGSIRVAGQAAARVGSALTKEEVEAAAAAGIKSPADTLLSRLVPLADQTATSSAATAASAADAAGSSASRAATAGATKLSQGLEDAGQAVKDAEDVESAAKDAAEVAKAARVAKAIKDAKEAETVADASEEGGDPFGVVIGGLIALGTAFIGSRVQVHSVVKPPPPNIQEISSYGSVAGA